MPTTTALSPRVKPLPKHFRLPVLRGYDLDSPSGQGTVVRFCSLLIPVLLMHCAGCSDAQLGVKIPFVATWGGAPIGCEGAEIGLSDLRFYVSDLALTDTDGRSHAVRLDRQLQWQQDDLALIDVESANRESRFAERVDERQSDVPEPDNTDRGRPALDGGFEFFFHDRSRRVENK